MRFVLLVLGADLRLHTTAGDTDPDLDPIHHVCILFLTPVKLQKC